MIKSIEANKLRHFLSIAQKPLKGWLRKRNNAIGQQSFNWLKGKEYFYSHYEQKNNMSELENQRRKNQDEVRHTYKDEIGEFLQLYKEIVLLVKQYIPNYKATEWDDFDYRKTINRLNNFGLIASKDSFLEVGEFHIFIKEQDLPPVKYWRKEVLKIREDRLKFYKQLPELCKNDFVIKLYPEINTYNQIIQNNTDKFLKFWIQQITQPSVCLGHSIFFHYEAVILLKTAIDKCVSIKNHCELMKQQFNTMKQIEKYKLFFDFFYIDETYLDSLIFDEYKFAERLVLMENYRNRRFEEFGEQIKATFSLTNKKQNALNLLGLKEKYTLKCLKKAYRSKAIETHPDRGGDAQSFIEVKEAYDLLISYLEK